jgi:alanine racemase
MALSSEETIILKPVKRRPGLVRATRAVVDLEAIRVNTVRIKEKIGLERKLMAVVKADGYGHGAVPVTQAVLAGGADYLAVTRPEEGRLLRASGVRCPILVFGLIEPSEAEQVVALGLSQTVASLELAEALDRAAARMGEKAILHLKVDTGMGRIGIQPEGALALVRKIIRLRHVEWEGLFSHFAVADAQDKSYSLQQIDRFESVLSQLKREGIEVPLRHFANSAATLDLPESYYDMVRPGLLLYGVYPSDEVSHSIPLVPAMELTTRVMAVKELPPGSSVSYGRTFTTTRTTLVATLPVGYADGYSRLLSNKAEVIVRGRRVPQIGTVCMDLTMADVSSLGDVLPGEEVVMFGRGLPVEELARKIGTISYEILCAIGKQVPRVYLNPPEGMGNGAS